jgi:hypothetical protein
MDSKNNDSRFPSPPYYVSKECKLIPAAVDAELTRLDTELEDVKGLLRQAQDMLSDAVYERDHFHANSKRAIDWLNAVGIVLGEPCKT